LVYEQLAVLGPTAGAEADRTGIVQLPNGHQLDAIELVEACRQVGAPGGLQEFIDTQDSLFGGVRLLATNSEAMSGDIVFANETFRFAGPGIVQHPTVALTEDLLEFRRQICAASERSDIDWSEIGRGYRGLILEASALFEVFMNRHLIAARSVGEDVSGLEDRVPFGEASDRWFEHFCPVGRDAIKAGKEWAHHQELRQLRDDMIHGNRAESAITLRTLPESLNRVTTGVGDLMCLVRKHQGRPKLGFMLRLANAPRATFNSYRARIARD